MMMTSIKKSLTMKSSEFQCLDINAESKECKRVASPISLTSRRSSSLPSTEMLEDLDLLRSSKEVLSLRKEKESLFKSRMREILPETCSKEMTLKLEFLS